MSVIKDVYEGSDYDWVTQVTQYEIVTDHLELIDSTLRFLRNVLYSFDVVITHDGHNIIFLNSQEDHVLVDPQWLLMAPLADKMDLCRKVLTDLRIIPPLQPYIPDYPSKVY